MPGEQLHEPDIVVTSPFGDVQLVVEAKRYGHAASGVEQVKRSMKAYDALFGLVVVGSSVVLVRDTLDSNGPSSMQTVERARLSDTSLPAADPIWRDDPSSAFESRVQRWLEHIGSGAVMAFDDPGMAHLVDTHLRHLLLGNEVRSGGPRWRRSVRSAVG